MRYIITIVWAAAISLVLTYVLSSMAGDSFVFAPVIVLTVLFSIAIFFIGDGVLKEEETEQ